MRHLYAALGERERRLYAATEALKLGRGGLSYVAHLLDWDPKTIRRGQSDLEQLQALPPQDIAPSERVRKKGAETGP